MIAVAKTEPVPGVEVIEVPTPQVQPGKVLIKVAAAAICGGDLKIYRWDPVGMKSWSRLKTFAFPRVLGHELSGTVVEVGDGVTELVVGDAVAVESHIPCGQCEFCKTGRMHLCKYDLLVGVGVDGGFAEYTSLPTSVTVKVPKGISMEQATLLEPLGVALHAVEVSGQIVGDRVVVLGCGPVGLYAALLARAGGASKVVMSDVSPYRTSLASRLGFAALLATGDDKENVEHLKEALGGQRAHVVFDAVGAPSTVSQALQVAATSGRVVLIGTFRGAGPLDTSSHIVHREVSVTGISGRRIYGTWDRLFDIVGSGLVDPVAVVTHRFPMTEAPEAFEVSARGEAGKVLLMP